MRPSSSLLPIARTTHGWTCSNNATQIK
jgi:hypothetical protein